MIRIKVCRISDIINNTIIFGIYVLLFIVFLKLSIKISRNMDVNLAKLFISNNLLKIEARDSVAKRNNIFKNIILAQLPNIKLKKHEEKYNNSEIEKFEIKNEYSSDIKNDILVVEKISGTKVKVGNVKIENYTQKELDYEALSKALAVTIPKNTNVFIYHTHTSESYSGIEEYSDYYRTINDENNVVSVGKTLKEELLKYGIKAEHDTTLHDYLSYGGAYKASLKTIEERMKKKDYEILIDIHRDALAANETFRPTAEINGETVAKLMFVIGTDTAGLKHDNWIENLKFAVAFQERANRMYPGLFRDIHLSTSRYNQHMSDKAMIVEVGATGNTIEEAKASMKYFAAILNSMK